LRIGVAVSRYHGEITDSMRDAAVETFTSCQGNPNNLHIVPAAGAFELPAVCRCLTMLQTRTGGPVLDAVVALGCVITGETTHDQYISHAVSQGLTAITVQTGVPIAFGVLTCQTFDQARARTVLAKGDRANKGAEAMLAAIETANTIKMVETSRGWR
jgi:6,7-dimethyl-8-ribityllumazine synthase